jgi:ELWxxDGT repeat protein
VDHAVLVTEGFPYLGQANITSYPIPGQQPAAPTDWFVFRNALYFQIATGASSVTGRQLWRYSTAGGVELVDPNPAGTDTFSKYFLVQGDRFFYCGATPAEGYGFYVSDGTPAGTQRFEIYPGVPAPYSAVPFGVVGQRFIFGGELNPGDGDVELIALDMTTGQRSLVKNINPTPPPATATSNPSSNPSVVATLFGRVFFTASSPTSGNELWSTDGTEAGTSLVIDANPGPGSSFPRNFQVVRSIPRTQLFFSAQAAGGGSPSDEELYVVTFCNADFNQNGAIELTDIFAFLNAWFTGDPSADFNQQNGVELGDIFAFLNAWFAGPC